MKFSIRDLLWLTVVVAILLAWWADHHRAAEEARQRSEKFLELENRVEQDRKFLTGLLKAKSIGFPKSGKTLHLKWTPGLSREPPDNWWLDEAAIKEATGTLPNSLAPAPNPPND